MVLFISQSRHWVREAMKYLTNSTLWLLCEAGLAVFCRSDLQPQEHKANYSWLNGRDSVWWKTCIIYLPCLIFPSIPSPHPFHPPILSIHLLIHLLHPSTHPSIYPSANPFTFVVNYPSTHWFIYPSIHLPTIHLHSATSLTHDLTPRDDEERVAFWQAIHRVGERQR